MTDVDAAPDWLQARAQIDERPFVTPEGVDLRVKLAGVSQRAAAFMIDGVIIVLGVIVFGVLTGIGGSLAQASGPNLARQVVIITLTLGLFLARNGYFMYFELGGRGATPGKRLMSIRVAARDGARLTAQAIFGRNVLREVEVMLPMTFLAIGATRPDGALFGAACLMWTGALLFLPLMNPDRLRLGDMVAGTWIVQAPRPSLRIDVSAAAEQHAQAFVFTEAQLSVYGEQELQVLEEVIRRNHRDAVAEVAGRIRRKIGWIPDPSERDLDFLDAYYLSLRRTLETGLLYGRRRRHKGDTTSS